MPVHAKLPHKPLTGVRRMRETPNIVETYRFDGSFDQELSETRNCDSA